MLVQCPTCKEFVVLRRFSTEKGAIQFTCGACLSPQQVLASTEPRAANLSLREIANVLNAMSSPPGGLSRPPSTPPLAPLPADLSARPATAGPAPGAAVAARRSGEQPVIQDKAKVPSSPSVPIPALPADPELSVLLAAVKSAYGDKAEGPAASPPPLPAPVAAASPTVSSPPSPEKSAPTQPATPPADGAPTGLTPPAQARVQGRERDLWAAWNKVAADWGTPKAHDAFIAFCMTRNTLPFAGTRYREHLQAFPKDANAMYGRDRVLAQAMAMAVAQRPDREEKRMDANTRKFMLLVAFGFLFILTSFLGLQVMRTLAHSTQGP